MRDARAGQVCARKKRRPARSGRRRKEQTLLDHIMDAQNSPLQQMWPVEKWELLLPFVYAIINKDPTATTFVFETLWTELEAQIEKWRYSCKQIRRKINENFVTLREHRDFVLPRAKPFEDAETLEHVAAICCQYRRDNKKAARPHWNATNINQRLKRQDFSVDAFKKRLRDSVALQEAQHLGNKEALRIMAAVGKRRRSLETARLVLLQPNAPDASRSLTAEAAPMPQALVRAVAAAASPVTKKGNVARPILWLGMSNKLLRKFEFVSSLPAQEEEIDDKLLALRRSRAGDLRKNLQAFAMRHSPNSPAIKGLYRVISELDFMSMTGVCYENELMTSVDIFLCISWQISQFYSI